MTKTIIIGETPKPEQPKNKIEFVKFLNRISVSGRGEFMNTKGDHSPDDFKYIELICLNYTGYDLMFCYNDPKQRSFGLFVIGKWNDGVV